MKKKVAFWDTKNPKKKSKTLTPAQKASAKAKAKAAGRPYPTLIDNAAAARGGFGFDKLKRDDMKRDLNFNRNPNINPYR